MPDEMQEATNALALIQGELQTLTAARDAYIAASNAELQRQEDVHQAYLQVSQTRIANYEVAIAALGRVLARLRARVEADPEDAMPTR